MFKLALLLGFVAVCWTQVPTPCGSPKQWQGVRIKRDRERDFFEKARYSYDAINMRTRATEEREVGKERSFYDVLHLYKENKTYRVDLQTKMCNVTTPGHPFFEVGIPTGSTFQFESEFGAAQIPNEHITVQNWYIKFSNGAFYDISVTVPDCVPVASFYHNNDTNELENYFDIHPGIKNETEVFKIPAACTGL